MTSHSNKTRYIPHLTAFLLFIAVTLVYFSPVLEGKVLQAHDTDVFKGSVQEIEAHRASFNEEPLWTNSMFSGMPSYLISARYPGNIIKHIYNFFRFPGIPLAPVILLMLGFYMLLLTFRINPWLAIPGSVAYGFSSYFFIILTAGHNSKAMALAFMAPLIASVIMSYRGKRVLGAGLTALFLSLQIIANHLQITYYTLLILLAFGLFELINSIREKEIVSFLKTTLLLFAAVIIALAVNFASLYTTFEYSKYSMRGKTELAGNEADDTGGLGIEYATQWSYGIDETLTFLIPNLKGGASVPFGQDSETVKALRSNNAAQYIPQFREYWGSQTLGTSGPVYVGSLMILLFIMGLVLIKNRDRWWILLATILAVMLAWGKNFMPMTSFFFNYFPAYNKFRAVTMILVIAEFCIPLLAMIVLNKIFSDKITKKELVKALKTGGGITVGLLLLYLLFPGIAGSFISPNEGGQLPGWLQNALVSDRKEMLRLDVLRALFFVSLSIAVIYYTSAGRIKVKHAVFILTLIVLADMWPVNKRYLNNDNFVSERVSKNTFAPSEADKFILQDKSYNRVLNLTVPDPFSDGSTSFHHHSIGGYHGAKIRRYQDLISHAIGTEINSLASGLRSATSMNDLEGIFDNTYALNMLNARYIIINPDARPLVNNNALGNAWFTDSIKLVSSPDEELKAIGHTNPAQIAIIDRKFENIWTNTDFGKDPDSEIWLEDYRANKLTYKSRSGETQIAVFSEIYYPEGWKAYINGNETDILRADYILRALIVPPGENEIVFTFEPKSYKTGNMVSLAGSVLLILSLLGAVYIETLNRKKTDDKSI